MTLPGNRPAPVISQSLRPCGAPAYASGPSVAARHLPTLWGVTLYTREAFRPCRGEPAKSCAAVKLRGRTVFAPTRPFTLSPVGRGLYPSLQSTINNHQIQYVQPRINCIYINYPPQTQKPAVACGLLCIEGWESI